jgi:hypothetical protein
MLNWLLNLHLDWITETSRQIQDQVEAMEEGFRTALPQSPKELRDMMKKRSDCNHTIRTINLRTRIDFTARVFTIAQKVWPSASNDHETSALMHKITQSKEYDPKQSASRSPKSQPKSQKTPPKSNASEKKDCKTSVCRSRS